MCAPIILACIWFMLGLSMNMWSTLLDLLFPPRATERIVRRCAKLNIPLPTSKAVTDGVVVLLSYQDQRVHAAIVENKYYHSERAAALLRDVLTKELQTLPRAVYCVPIPLGPKRQKERGYNQVTNILTLLQMDDCSVQTRILLRTRDTPPQTSLSKVERLKNVRDAFTVQTEHLHTIPANATIVLVDDVLTTGSTMRAAKNTLTPYLPPTATLICIALAH